MLKKMVLASAFTLLASAAMAQTAPSGGSSASSPTAGSSRAESRTQSGHGGSIAQSVVEDLQKSGFSNVEIVGETFQVFATTRNGDNVVMTIERQPESSDDMTSATSPSQPGASGSRGGAGATAPMSPSPSRP